MDNWTGVILAGGIGSRLRPLTQYIPKPLVQVANKPMLDYAIDHLKYAGIKEIIVVVKHLGEKIRVHMEEEWFSNEERLGDLHIEVPHVNSLDTADALRKVDDLIETDYVLVSMGDIVTNLPLKDFLQYHVKKGGIASISMKEIEEPKQYGVVILDPDGKIQVFLEKPTSQELYLSSFIQQSEQVSAGNLINTGIYAFKSDIIDLLRNDNSLMDFGKNVFPYLLENRFSIYGFVEKYYWMDVGQAKPYLWANWDLLRGYGWPVTPRGTDHGGLWYDEKPDVSEGLKIDPPCALGKVQFGKNVHIKQLTTLDDNVTIGDGSKVERSTIWKNVTIGKDCDIKESIVCNDVELGDGVTLVNCTIGPQSKIASGRTLQYEKVITKSD